MDDFTDIVFLILLSLPMIILISPIILIRQEKRHQANSIEKKKRETLKAIVLEDIEVEDTQQRSLKERVLEYYDKEEITPELLDYFSDNYLSFLEAESKRIENQKIQDEKMDQKLDRNFQDLEKARQAQLNAFKKVKELSSPSVQLQGDE